MKTRAITEGALMAALTLVCALLAYYVPFFTVFTYFLLPLPTIVLYKRYGLTPAAVEGVASALLLMLFMDPLNAGLYGADILLPGLLLGYGYYSDKGGGTRILLGYFAFLGALALEMLLFERVTGVTVMEDFINEINTVTDALTNSYRSAGMLTGESGQVLQDSLSQINDYVKMLFPTFILLMPAIVSWTAVLIDDMFFKRFKLSYKPVQEITQWRVPVLTKNLIGLAFIGSVLIGWALQSDPVLYVYPFTVESLCYFFYTVMGFAFIFWLMQKQLGSRFTWLRICIIICCLVFTNLMSVVTLVGLIDVCFDIRRFFEKRESP